MGDFLDKKIDAFERKNQEEIKIYISSSRRGEHIMEENKEYSIKLLFLLALSIKLSALVQWSSLKARAAGEEDSLG
jgi:hypothetical protein